ncbi:MAG: hypothetical protein IJB79_03840 [Candidatus Gastranaerophilales bacterium]|nr:hypothetical protein [Candidatus Gastranaerophilales bacterium]
MSNEVATQQKASFGSAVMGCMAFPAITTTGSAAAAIKTHGGVSKAIKAQKHADFKNLNTAMKNAGADVFTRSQTIARAYDDGYKEIAKTASKTSKKLSKLNKKQDISLFDKFKNLFKKEGNKITFESKHKAAQEAFDSASSRLKTANEALEGAAKKFDSKALDEAFGLCEKTRVKQGEEIVEQIVEGKGIFQNADNFAKKATQELVEAGTKAGAKTAAKGFGNAVKQNFVRELGWKNGKLNYFMTALQFFPNLINEVIPTFKEEGFAAGMKATGKTAIRMAADLVGYSAGGAVGRVIGAVIGGIICPGVGNKVGAAIGDAVCTMVVGGAVTKGVDKALGVEQESKEAPAQEEAIQTVAQNEPQVAMQEPTSQPVVQNEAQTQQDLTAKYANMPSKSEIKQAAYKQAFQGKGGRFNTYYA